MDEHLTERAQPPNFGALERRGVLGHPLAFASTAIILLLLFAWPFLNDPGRQAPTKDPAYYTWRTEAMISEDPVKLLEIEGAFDMFAGGYRVAAPIIGGYLRQIPALSSLKTTVAIMVALPVVTALLLAGFAFRQRRDPLLFHSVAFASAGLFLTPPFVGYLDNMLALLFLAAALWFLGSARSSWPARAGLGMFLLMVGFTHPTTLAIFCLTLGAMAAVRWVFSRFDLRATLRADGSMLMTAFVSAVATYAIWKIGPWGQSASLGESALPPPYDSDFFLHRLGLWVDAMRPALNGPLLLLGAAGLLRAGKRAVDDDLTRASIVWLLPLVGMFGFLAGLAYPYYRFFNTTLAWVLLVGVGTWFALRFFIERGRSNRWFLIGVVPVVLILATNLTYGFELSGWTNPNNEWLSPAERESLDAIRSALSAPEYRDRKVVFVIDDRPDEAFQIWGFTKLSGNTARYAVPSGRLDDMYLYLGRLENYLDDQPTILGEDTYDKLTRALLEDARVGTGGGSDDEPPLVILANIFNGGPDTLLAFFRETVTFGGSLTPQAAVSEVWSVNGPQIENEDGRAIEAAVEPEDAGSVHVLRAGAGLLVLFLPGFLALPWFFGYHKAGYQRVGAEGIGMVAALSVAMLFFVAFVVLSVARSPFSSGLAWLSWSLAVALGIALRLASLHRRSLARLPRGRLTYPERA